jgi:DNA-binding response OmpR family regulator
MDSDIRYGKELGVDDYLTKPIRAGDLLAAVRGRLRRVQDLRDALGQSVSVAATDTHILKIERLRIDSKQHRVWLDDQEITLSAKEFALLEYLGRQNGSIVSPQELIRITHELETDPIDAGQLLRPLILSLRRKLNLSPGEIGSVENVRGVGYRLVVTN